MINTNKLNIGDASDNGQVTIIDEDRLCYLVKSTSRGAYGLRTISKSLLSEYVEYFAKKPDASANDARDALCGNTDIDKFEYGYTSTLKTMAQMVLGQVSIISATLKSVTKPPKHPIFPLQTIFYGAPGTGKSHKIDGQTNDDNSIRTTFHPDTDYATFVGAYKPTMDVVDEYALDATGKTHQVVYPNGKKSIAYKFEPQVFLKAYVEAWKRCLNKQEGEDDSYFLVIEEINRGNCAQIFGDLFQLLDREDSGYSSYAISPESAITKYLAEEAQSADGTKFSDLEFSDVTKYRDGAEKVVATADDLKAGKRLVLPPNLHIWATMNTSDQSLFPIDSAFKRRWDWKYVPIRNCPDKNWKIKIGEKEYDWWTFLQAINKSIFELTKLEDKKLGFFFCKAQNGIISAKTFIGKVFFYLWNDVFKDYDYSPAFFRNENGELIEYSEYYNEGGDTPNIERIQDFIEKVEPKFKEILLNER